MSEYSQQIQRILELATKTQGHSQATLDQLDEAAHQVKLLSEILKVARLRAIANINSLDDMLAELKAVLEGSGNMEVMQAVGNIELAREKMNEHQQALLLQQDRVDALYSVLKLGRVKDTMQDARAAFVAGVIGIQEYIKGVE